MPSFRIILLPFILILLTYNSSSVNLVFSYSIFFYLFICGLL